MTIHNQSTLPYAIQSGINIKTGFETYVGINREFKNKLPSPFSNCLEDLTTSNAYGKILFKYFDYLNVSYYDQNFCNTMCYQDKLIDICGCCDIITPSIRNASFCANDKEIKCLKQFNQFFSLI